MGQPASARHTFERNPSTRPVLTLITFGHLSEGSVFFANPYIASCGEKRPAETTLVSSCGADTGGGKPTQEMARSDVGCAITSLEQGNMRTSNTAGRIFLVQPASNSENQSQEVLKPWVSGARKTLGRPIRRVTTQGLPRSMESSRRSCPLLRNLCWPYLRCHLALMQTPIGSVGFAMWGSSALWDYQSSGFS